MKPLSKKQKLKYSKATHCHICEEKLNPKDKRKFEEYQEKFDSLNYHERQNLEDKGPKLSILELEINLNLDVTRCEIITTSQENILVNIRFISYIFQYNNNKN